MNVNSINTTPYFKAPMQNKNNNNPNFGHKIIMDIGASNPKGSMKLLALKDNGEELFKIKGFVNNTVKGFNGNEDFLNKIMGIVKDAQTKILDGVAKKDFKLKGKDKLLSGLAIFVPGTTCAIGGMERIAFIPNLRDRQNNSLDNIEFDKFKKDIINGKKDPNGVKATKDFKLCVTKDLGGCGLALARLLAEKGDLNEGDYIMGVMTGGGFGSVDIKVKDSKVEFETSESSSYLTGNFEAYNFIAKELKQVANSDDPKTELAKFIANNNEAIESDVSVLGKLGRQGVSVKSHIKTYFNALGLHELGKVALQAGDARIVEDNYMVLNKKKDKDVIEEISKHSEFVKEPDDDPEKIRFKLSEKVVSEDKMREARNQAVNSYANSVSLITINKINDCVNKVILAGPFAHGVNRYISEHPQDFNGATDLPSLIKQKIERNVDEKHVDLPTTKKLMNLYHLNIICDPELNFDDNTFAGDLLLGKKLSFVPNRGSWFSVPLDALTEGKPAKTK